MDHLADDEISGILTTARSIALVGLSDDPSSPSRGIVEFPKSARQQVHILSTAMLSKPGVRGHVLLRRISPPSVDLLDISPLG